MKLLIIFALLAHLNETQKSPSFLVANRPVGQVGEPSWFGGYFSMVTSKKCAKCKEVKLLTEFHPFKRNKDGKDSYCKDCKNLLKKKLRRTKEGFAVKAYGTQIRNSNHRGHPLPSYTKEEFRDWLFGQEKFHVLHKKWVESDYDTSIIPSVDRKDDYKPYTFDNIQLMTWGDNLKKFHRDLSLGLNRKPLRAVIQMDLHGNVIAEHYSVREAERRTGVRNSGINVCCRGKYTQSGGFKWKFKDEK